MCVRLRASACLLIIHFCLASRAEASIVVPVEWYGPTQQIRQADDLPAFTPSRATPIRFRSLWVRWDQPIA